MQIARVDGYPEDLEECAEDLPEAVRRSAACLSFKHLLTWRDASRFLLPAAAQEWYANTEDGARWISLLSDERSGARGLEWAMKVFNVSDDFPLHFFAHCCGYQRRRVVIFSLWRRVQGDWGGERRSCCVMLIYFSESLSLIFGLTLLLRFPDPLSAAHVRPQDSNAARVPEAAAHRLASAPA